MFCAKFQILGLQRQVPRLPAYWPRPISVIQSRGFSRSRPLPISISWRSPWWTQLAKITIPFTRSGPRWSRWGNFLTFSSFELSLGPPHLLRQARLQEVWRADKIQVECWSWQFELALQVKPNSERFRCFLTNHSRVPIFNHSDQSQIFVTFLNDFP